ncbi:Hint domain-containing protein [Gymnodinialimonas ceratoperidinii]|uniref:Hint domain-containing protein n=1 Tax=Gymnodinialimonas ceratoperidinii TaxID=2856823 RepID=A0A8F6YCP5_9RHOB|nr:Hint domain-containing protein [Gymnodinialimonas ceratoperidinii]QXT39565.1 Hint domain-containing protein [Gymnodinialimonas ceratoperidinii]
MAFNDRRLTQQGRAVSRDAGGDGDHRNDPGKTFVIRDGHGCDVIKGFSPRDTIAFDMAEIRTVRDVFARTSGITDTTIRFDNGDWLRLEGIAPKVLKAENFSFTVGPICFLAGTPMLTERGEVPIEDLRPDDILWTKDHGWQALRLVVRETIAFTHRDDKAKPILIPAGALGPGQPAVDLKISPQHRILRMMEDTGDEVLVPAIDLVGRNGIRQMRGKKRAEYLNVVMERHSVVQVAGCWLESLLVTSRYLSGQTRAARQLLDRARTTAPARRVERIGVRPRHLKTG